MSGGSHQHPHGRQGQPNPTPGWSPLQLPNYYPGRPQVAHMSSDRPMAHSPLTWHTPTPPEHQKGAPNPYRHTPTPPDVQVLKAASTLPYRHTPTPPDLKSFRHTPTPPDVAHSMKTTGVLHYRHTPPPPDVHKGAPSPLFNLQQMISDTRGAPRDTIRDNIAFSRHSPGLTHGSMDLSVTRSPRNGSQNGETITPISLSVRDATKINSLDSAEISKIHQPLLYSGKPLDNKPSSPTINAMSQRSSSPKSPLSSNKRPAKKVDSILERLNSVGDGVVITPVQHTPSPQSVIVSAHSLEDSNSRSSTSSVNITHTAGIAPYFMCEAANMERITPPAPLPHNSSLLQPVNEPASVSLLHIPTSLESASKTPTQQVHPTQPIPQSVIKESTISQREENAPPSNCSNEDSSGSFSDSGRPRRKRKLSKTLKSVEDESIAAEVASAIDSKTSEKNESNFATQVENHSMNVTPSSDALVTRLTDQLPVITTDTLKSGSIDVTPNGMPSLEEKENKDESVPVVSKTRRKNSSESETIDNIAAMIASTENPNSVCLPDKPVSEVDAPLGDCATSEMHAEQLKEVLGSPKPESEPVLDSASNDVPQPDTTPRKPLKRKRASRSQSIELSQIDAQPPSGITDSSKISEKPSSNFVEVENELEKMFAGIEKNDPISITESLVPVENVPTDNPLLENAVKKGRKRSAPKKKKIKAAKKACISTSQNLPSNEELPPKKKGKRSKAKEMLLESEAGVGGKKKRSKGSALISTKKCKRDKSSDKAKLELIYHKDAYDSGSNASSSKSRGPYVQIKGPRDSPLSVSVINNPIVEEDGDKPVQKVKTFKSKSVLNSDRDFKNKVKSKGLHSSTLSMKYDATTIDTSWICVFCKKGPHTGGTRGPQSGYAKQMGDLFGPYIITTNCPDFNSMIGDPQDSAFKNKAKAGTFYQNKQAKPHGRKSKSDVENPECKLPKEQIHFGMTEAGNNSYEVWVHEDCAVWAPGVYLVGAKIVGLDSAVWGSCTVGCDHCQIAGANVACLKRGCNKNMHVNCARTEIWSLNENTFRVYCREHAVP